jgi:probable HAF family extracellular repeat protein
MGFPCSICRLAEFSLVLMGALPLYLGDPATLPLAINDSGQIVAIAQQQAAAIVWANGAWSAVAPLAGGQWTAVLDIDEAGNMVGVGTVGTTSPDPAAPLHAFLQKAGMAAVDLGLASQSSAHRISSAGDVAGIFGTDAGTTHAFVYRAGSKSLTDLGTLGGTNSAASPRLPRIEGGDEGPGDARRRSQRCTGHR